MGKIHGAIICTVLYSIYSNLIDVVANRPNVSCDSGKYYNVDVYINVWCINFNSIV